MTHEDCISRTAYLAAQIRDMIRQIPGATAAHISDTGKVSIKLDQPGILLSHSPKERQIHGLGAETYAVISGVEVYYLGSIAKATDAQKVAAATV